MDDMYESLRKHLGIYKKKVNDFKDQIKKINIKKFDCNYQDQDRPIFATDGSYLTYYKIPSINLFFSSVNAIGIGQKYNHHTNPSLRSYDNIKREEKQINMILNMRSDLTEEIPVLKRGQIKWAMEHFMGRLEKQILYQHAKENTNHLIMVDGSLIQQGKQIDPPEKIKPIIGDKIYKEIQREGTIKELVNVCKNRNILSGVSKDSSM